MLETQMSNLKTQNQNLNSKSNLRGRAPRKFIASLLIFFLLADLAIFGLLYPKYVYGTTVPTSEVGGPTSTANLVTNVKNTIESTIQTTTQVWDKIYKVLKDLIKYIGYVVLHTVLSMLTNSIIQWINSDFKGKPSFITDFKRYFRQALDNVAGSLINELGLGFLCEHIDLKLTVNLLSVPTFPETTSCTLSKVIANVEEFFDKFEEGGFAAFIELGKPRNNQIGATLLTIDELALRQTKKGESEKQETLFGQGFLSIKKCADEQTLTDEELNAEIEKRGKEPESQEPVGETKTKEVEKEGKKVAQYAGGSWKVCWKYDMKNPASLMGPAAVEVSLKDFKELRDSISNLSARIEPFGPYVLAIASALINHIIMKGFAMLAKDTTKHTKVRIPEKAKGFLDLKYSEDIMTKLIEMRETLLKLNDLHKKINNQKRAGREIQIELLNMMTWVLVFNHPIFNKISQLHTQTDQIIENINSVIYSLSEKMKAGNEPDLKFGFLDEINSLLAEADNIISIAVKLDPQQTSYEKIEQGSQVEGIIVKLDNISYQVTISDSHKGAGIINTAKLAKQYLQELKDYEEIKPSDLQTNAAISLQTAAYSLKDNLSLLLFRMPDFFKITSLKKAEDFSSLPEITTEISEQLPTDFEFEPFDEISQEELADFATFNPSNSYTVETQTTKGIFHDAWEAKVFGYGISNEDTIYRTSQSCEDKTIVTKIIIDPATQEPIEFSETLQTEPDEEGNVETFYMKGYYAKTEESSVPCGTVLSHPKTYVCRFFTVPTEIINPDDMSKQTVACNNFLTYQAWVWTTFKRKSLNIMYPAIGAMLGGLPGLVLGSFFGFKKRKRPPPRYHPQNQSVLPDNISGGTLPKNDPTDLKAEITAEQVAEENSQLLNNLELAVHAANAIGVVREYFEAAEKFSNTDPADEKEYTKAFEKMVKAKHLAIDMLQPVIQDINTDPRKQFDEEEIGKVLDLVSKRAQQIENKHTNLMTQKMDLDEKIWELWGYLKKMQTYHIGPVYFGGPRDETPLMATLFTE